MKSFDKLKVSVLIIMAAIRPRTPEYFIWSSLNAAASAGQTNDTIETKQIGQKCK